MKLNKLIRTMFIFLIFVFAINYSVANNLSFEKINETKKNNQLKDLESNLNLLNLSNKTIINNNLNILDIKDEFEKNLNFLNKTEAANLIEEIFKEYFGEDIIIFSNQRVYTTTLRKKTYKITFDKFIITPNKTYGIIYEDIFQLTINLDDSIKVFESPKTKKEIFEENLRRFIEKEI